MLSLIPTTSPTMIAQTTDKVTPNQVLGDVMTDAQYDDDENEDEKKEIKVKQKKPIAFKASSTKSKSKIDSDNDDLFDDETMTLLVQKMGRFMKKRGYGARKRRDHMKSREMLCYNCNSSDHVVAKCPYKDKRYNDGELKLKKKDKKEKKAKKSFTFNKKKKGGGYVVTWDSDNFVVMMMQALVMMKGPLGEPLQASPSPTSHPSSTLHRHALWPSLPR
jgi:hypothetical protein